MTESAPLLGKQMDPEESEGAEGGGWQQPGRGKSKRAAQREWDEVPEKQRRTKGPEELVVLLRVKGARPGAAGFKAINPLQVDLSLQNQIGKGYVAKILFNGVLRVSCMNRKQYEEAKNLGKVVTKVERVEITPRGSEGVVYGMFAGLSEQEILDNVRGGEVVAVRRFNPREETRGDPPVLLTFKDAQLPGRVYLGAMAYQVREYVRPPLRCYNCQRYGHIADACRGKKRCAKCGGEHGIKECDADRPKCPNCGGEHGAAYGGCEHTIKARQVQAVRERDKVSYAEAVRTVTREHREERGRVTQGHPRAEPSSLPADMLIMSRESFLSFVVEVLAAAKQIFASKTSNSSDIIREVVGAADKFLGTKQVPEKLFQHMSEVRKKLQRLGEEREGEEDIADHGEG